MLMETAIAPNQAKIYAAQKRKLRGHGTLQETNWRGDHWRAAQNFSQFLLSRLAIFLFTGKFCFN
jgi:hypothetical protein